MTEAPERVKAAWRHRLLPNGTDQQNADLERLLRNGTTQSLIDMVDRGKFRKWLSAGTYRWLIAATTVIGGLTGAKVLWDFLHGAQK